MNTRKEKRIQIIKEALWSELIGAGKAVIPKITGAATKASRSVLTSGTGKKMLVGSGLGAGVGASRYNPETDTGSFTDSRLGKALGGAALGAAGGAALGAATKGLAAKSVAKESTKSAPKLLNAGTAPKQITQYSVIPEQVKNMPNFTTKFPNKDVIDVTKYKMASRLVENMYIEKIARINPDLTARIKNLASRIKKIPELFSNADPMIRMILGAAVGGGGFALTKEVVDKAEKVVDSTEKKKKLGITDRAVEDMTGHMSPKGKKIFKGTMMGAALAYAVGKNKVKLN